MFLLSFGPLLMFNQVFNFAQKQEVPDADFLRLRLANRMWKSQWFRACESSESRGALMIKFGVNATKQSANAVSKEDARRPLPGSMYRMHGISFIVSHQSTIRLTVSHHLAE